MRASRWKRPSATNTRASQSAATLGAVQPSTSPGDRGRACGRCEGEAGQWGERFVRSRASLAGDLLSRGQAAAIGGQHSQHSSVQRSTARRSAAQRRTCPGAHLGDVNVRVVRRQRQLGSLDARGKLDRASQHQAGARWEVAPAERRDGAASSGCTQRGGGCEQAPRAPPVQPPSQPPRVARQLQAEGESTHPPGRGHEVFSVHTPPKHTPSLPRSTHPPT